MIQLPKPDDLFWKRARLASIAGFFFAFSLILPAAVNRGCEWATLTLIPAGISMIYSLILLVARVHARENFATIFIDLMLGICELVFLMGFWVHEPSRRRGANLAMLSAYGSLGVIADM